MKKALPAALVLVLALAAAACASEPGFTAKPAAVRRGNKVTIRFAVSAPTDVEVAVLDAGGKVVRHLAAGLLGSKAPGPLKKNSLVQEVTWDIRDDFGKPAKGGPFRVRVSLGLKPSFARMIGDNPGRVLCPQGLAVGPKGELFVLHIFGRIHPDDNSAACTVYDRSGKYLRTILPYPANLPEEKLKGLKCIEIAPGDKAPFLYDAETRAIVAGAGNVVAHQPVVTKDGRFVFIAHDEKPRRYNNYGVKRVTVINRDGSMPAGGPYRTVLASKSKGGGALALAPDGKTFYATGISEHRKPATSVYRFALNEKDPRAFIKEGLKAPTGVATDAAGNIYVADNGADRVVVFKANGARLGELKIDKPDQVAVNAKTGAVYVFTSDRQIVKYAGWRSGKAAAEVKVTFVTRSREPKALTLAVDSSASPTVLWAGIGGGHFSSGSVGDVWRIEDKGGRFSDPVSINRLAGNDRPSAGPVIAMALDRAKGRLLIGTRIFDLATGKWTKGLRSFTGSAQGMGSFGLDGNLYVQRFFNTSVRYGPDLKPRPFAVGPRGAIVYPKAGVGEIHASGITADVSGNVYLLWNKGKGTRNSPHPHDLALHKPDGTQVNAHLVSSQVRQLCSPRLDLKGNIYLGVGVRPAGMRVPKGLKADFGKPWNTKLLSSEMEWYQLLYGCIVKFGPKGGAIRAGAGGVPVEYGWAGKKGFTTEIKGAQWVYFGASPVVSWRNSLPDVCFCESPRFDVDRFGRVFYPDAGRFRVGVLDTAGNHICNFGAYGNADSAGPKSRVPAPKIPLFWPYLIEVGERMVYVGDRLNRRVVAVRLGYAVEEFCAVR